MLWRIAWRNLWRHRTRTLIMTSAVALTYALALVGLGISDDGHQRMLDEAITAAGGEILVHAEGYWDTRASDAVIARGDAALEAVRSTEAVETAIPRVLVSGLVSTSAGSQPVLLQGVRPELEATLSDVAGDVTRGTFLGDERSDPLVLGSRIVEKLELELGDRVVLTASDPEGELTRALFHLTGVLETGTRELDERLGYTTLEAAQGAVAMEGMLSQIGVLVVDGADPDTVAARIARALDGTRTPGTASGDSPAPAADSRGPAAAGAPDSAASADGMEVLTWREALPEMVGFIELDDAFGYVYMAVIFLVVLFSIANTFLMAVMERVRELGLLSALGLKGRKIGWLVLSETVLMTVLAMGVGFLLGLGGHLAVDHWGISMASYGIEDMELAGVDFADLVMYSTITPIKWIWASILVAVATVASALYPAWRATRLAPAEAMRFFE